MPKAINLDHITEEQLTELFCEKFMSTKEIASKLGITAFCVLKLIKKFELKQPIRFLYQDKEWFKQEYIVKNRSVISIANEFGVNPSTMDKYRARFGLIKYEFNSKATALDLKDIKEKYITQQMSLANVAEIYGCSTGTISKFLNKNGITKTSAEIATCSKNTMLSRYGVTNTSDVPGSKERRIITCMERYGFESATSSPLVKAKVKKTSTERYGTDSYLQTDEFKATSKVTCLQKYGAEFAASSDEVKRIIVDSNMSKFGVPSPMMLKETQEKARKTNLEKYGFECPLKNPQVKEKSKATNIWKYGMENPTGHPDIMRKRAETTFKRFGVIHATQNPEIIAKIKKTNLERYGSQCYNGSAMSNSDRIEVGRSLDLFGKIPSEWADKYNISRKSFYDFIHNNSDISEPDLVSFCENFHTSNTTDIENILSSSISVPKWNKSFHTNLRYRPDFKINDTTAVNVDGLYWHCELKHEPKYHFVMRTEYERESCRILQFRADEVKKKLHIVISIINNILGKTGNRIYARKTTIKIVSQDMANNFLIENHMMGPIQAKHMGLFDNDRLVMIMSYKTRGNIIKIDRLCSITNHNVIGGFSKLLSFLEGHVKHNEIHYWVDLRYGVGDFLKNQGFVHERDTLGWKWTDLGFNTFNRLQCRANMDSRKLSEKEYAEELGWVKIYDAGQRLFIKRRTKK